LTAAGKPERSAGGRRGAVPRLLPQPNRYRSDAEQWQQLAKLSVEKGWLPLFDFAYQGFARGLEEDAEGLRAFAALHKELLVASSYSKNFGLYNERVGACTLVAAIRRPLTAHSAR
jgi:aspartate/tyrosine/aromatic aminotransferase